MARTPRPARRSVDPAVDPSADSATALSRPARSAGAATAPPSPLPRDVAGERHSAEAIAQDLVAAIVEKRLPPGTWLREEALAKVYGVSRTKIRAALLTLARDKLVESVPDKGNFVRRPSVTEAREIFALRRLLEAEVTRLFIAIATPADYAHLAQHIETERSTLGNRAQGAAREWLLGDFHVLLARACGNQTLAELVGDLINRSSLIAMLYGSTNDTHCSSDEHARFLKLARSGDVAGAMRCMNDHLVRLEASLEFDPSSANRQLDLVKALLS